MASDPRMIMALVQNKFLFYGLLIAQLGLVIGLSGWINKMEVGTARFVFLFYAALTGGMFNLATLLIGQQISGDVLHNPGLGYAIAMGMVIIMALSILFYSILQRRSERWLG